MDVLPTSARSNFRSYSLGFGVALVAATFQWMIMPWVGDRVPFLFFIPALIFCAVSLGRGPALLVLVFGAINASLLAPPVGSFEIRAPQDIAALLAYILLASMLVVYGGHIRRFMASASRIAKRLAMAQEDTGIGVFELDYRNGTAYVSPSLCQILGQARQQGPIPLNLWLNRLSAGHVEESRHAMDEHVRRGEMAYEREQRIVRPDGDIRWLFHRVRLETDSSGKVERARGATVDITERKQLDLALQTAKAQLEQQLGDQQRLHAFTQKVMSAGDDVASALRDLLAMLVDLYGTPYGVISLCDSGNPRGQIVARCGLADAPAEHLSARNDAAQAEASETPDSRVAPAKFGYEALLGVHEDLMRVAGLRDLHSMPFVDGQGRITGAVSLMFRELHEPSQREIQLGEIAAATAAALVQREEARIATAREENRFSVVMESSLVGFNIISPVRDSSGAVVDFRWEYINPAAAQALGRDASELVGRQIGEVLPLVWTAPGLFQHYVDVVDRGVAREFDIKSNATGRGGWFNVVASPLQGSAAVWFADITARKLHEKDLHDADRRKDELLATLAHELRNPLAPIRQCLRIISARSSTDAQRRWSESIIERQVNTMSLLLEDLLDVSRFGRGSLVLRKSREQLSAVLEGAIETARPHIDAKRHRLEVQSLGHALWVEVDPLRIAQVVSNLLINAAKYMDPAGTIRLRAGVDDLGLAIIISDDGIGMSPNQIETVFQLFSQVPSSIEKSQGGLGIGLALARGLVELHGGTIAAASAGPGHGSTFTVRLPTSCLVPCAVAPEQDTVLPKGADHGSVSRRILIADDNVDSADSLAELLRLDGHEVHVAYDGAQALDMFSQVDPDTVLLDVSMPRVSGLQVARSIRADFTGRRATLIAVTGLGQERDRRVAFDSGFDHHLIKPVLPEDIEALLQQT